MRSLSRTLSKVIFQVFLTDYRLPIPSIPLVRFLSYLNFNLCLPASLGEGGGRGGEGVAWGWKGGGAVENQFLLICCSASSENSAVAFENVNLHIQLCTQWQLPVMVKTMRSYMMSFTCTLAGMNVIGCEHVFYSIHLYIIRKDFCFLLNWTKYNCVDMYVYVYI